MSLFLYLGNLLPLQHKNPSFVETLSLYDLNEFIRQVVISNFGQEMWVTCEISQVNLSRGHRYIELIQKDEETQDIIARMGAVIWSRDYAALRRKHRNALASVLAEANQVRLQVKVDFHERFGMKLMIKDIDLNYTIGQFAERRLFIISQLEKEDLLYINESLPLPRSIQRVAVISSETAAGFADYRAHLEENEYGYDYRTHLFPAAMQGKQVEPEVLTQLSIIKKRCKEFDVVVIIRGGGSKIDLADFDSYALGKMIATFPIPVFTGIGHEIDESVIDLVAAKAFKTPTAVASYLIQHNLETEQEILTMEHEVVQLAQNVLSEKRHDLENVQQFIPLLVKGILERSTLALQQLDIVLARAFAQAITLQEQKLTHILALIDTTRPERILKKGYSITYLKGRPITQINSLQIGDTIETRIHTGVLHSKINKIDNNG